MERNHVLELDSFAAVIQTRIRGILKRKRRAVMLRAITAIQKWYRRARSDREVYLKSAGDQRRRFLQARRMFERSTRLEVVRV